MLKLYKITKGVRRGLKIAGILFVVYLVFFFGTKIVVFIKNRFYPIQPLGPTQRFGKLPKVDFPQQPPYNITFKINTFSGTLPFFPSVINIYKFKTREQKLLDLKNARERLRNLNFTQRETKITDTLYQWQHAQIPHAFILYDIVLQNFEIHSDYIRDKDILSARNLPKDTSKLKLIVLDYLRQIGQDTSDIDETKTTFKYLAISQKKVFQVDQIGEAQIVRVDLFQKAVEDKPIYYQQPNQSNMYFLIGAYPTPPSKISPRILEAYFPRLVVDKTNVSTYPLKSAPLAYDELTKGKAYIINEGGLSEIEILNVTLSYYIGSNLQQFLIPIIVFEGRGFKAFVHAIPNTSILN